MRRLKPGTKIAVCVAPTGGTRTKADTPYIPLTPEEIADVVVECHGLGATIAHLHVRDEDGGDTCSGEVYQKANALIRARCDIFLNNSSGGGSTGKMVREIGPGRREVDFESRMQTFDGRGEAVIIDAITETYTEADGSSTLFKTDEAEAQRMLDVCLEKGIVPEFAIYSHEHYAERVKPLIDSLAPSQPYQLALAWMEEFGTEDYRPEEFARAIAMLPEHAFLTIGGKGRHMWAHKANGILLGANCIRVGIENQPYDLDGKPVTNQELVRKAVALVKAMGCELATPADVRSMLGVEMR